MKLEIAGAVLAILLFSTGDTLAAAWGKTGNRWWFLAMLLVGNLAWCLFAYLNKTMPLGVVSGIVNVGLTLLSVLAGWLIFRERLQPIEKVGLAVGFVSLCIFVYARANAPPHTVLNPVTSQDASLTD